ncbi:eukaryotic translation initiation factor 3 subunit A-like [Haliotis asinina]|uniref:eukaryotic translation initiation factor 3 subunit A-like n=1 Tax=Haliotis asinina TaxID=109174 RepID=UPI003531E44D
MTRFSREQRDLALGRLNAGQTARHVANNFSVHIRTIYRLQQRVQATGSTADRPHGGRTLVTTLRQNRQIVRHHLQNRFARAMDCTDKHWRSLETNQRRHLRRLRQRNVRGSRPHQSPILTARHRLARLRRSVQRLIEKETIRTLSQSTRLQITIIIVLCYLRTDSALVNQAAVETTISTGFRKFQDAYSVDAGEANRLYRLLEDRRQKTEDRRQETEDKTGDRRQKTEDRRQETGDRRQKTEDRRQKTEDRRQETEDRRQETEDTRQETLTYA